MTKVAWVTDRSVMASLLVFGWLFGQLGEEVAEPIQGGFPASAAFGNPPLGGPEPGGFDVEGAYAADFFGAHEAAGLQDVEMLHDRRHRHRERLGELANRGGRAAQALDHAHARGISQGVEEAVERCLL